MINGLELAQIHLIFFWDLYYEPLTGILMGSTNVGLCEEIKVRSQIRSDCLRFVFVRWVISTIPKSWSEFRRNLRLPRMCSVGADSNGKTRRCHRLHLDDRSRHFAPGNLRPSRWWWWIWRPYLYVVDNLSKHFSEFPFSTSKSVSKLFSKGLKPGKEFTVRSERFQMYFRLPTLWNDFRKLKLFNFERYGGECDDFTSEVNCTGNLSCVWLEYQRYLRYSPGISGKLIRFKSTLSSKVWQLFCFRAMSELSFGAWFSDPLTLLMLR